MRNLKRALSLALASIMVIGMMVVGAGAVSNGDFSDKDKIVNTEAVSVLTTLNVINGREDGSYDPTGVVTRGEMAKMICVILNGGKDPQLGETVSNSYSDTAGHWAKAYIEYCTTLGIVAGRNNGTFEPNATVTVAEAGKMLLVALGYNASVEGYTGANWQINTDVRANQKGLYDGIGGTNTSTALTRDNAAQMCYNALDVRMVQYSYVITGTADNSIATKPQIDDTKMGTLLFEKFNAVKVEGVVVGNEYADMSSNKSDSDLAPGVVGTSLDADKTKVIVTNGEDQSKYTGTQTFNVASGLDVLGHNVALFVKVESSASKAQVIGSVIMSDDNKVVTDYSGDSIYDVADDNNLEIASNARVANNYASLGALSTTAAKADSTVGVEKVLIDYDNDGEVDYVLLNTTEFGKVTKYSTADKGSMTVSLASGSFNATKSANVVGFEDVKKDDYVIACYIGGKLHVAVAETVTGNIEAYKNNSKNTLTTKLTVDGTEYTVAATNSVTVAADEVYPAKALFTGSDKTALDTQATFYLDANGYIVARGQVVESAYNYALVKAADDGTSTVDNRVRVVLPDGKTGVYTLSDKSTVKLAEVRTAIASNKTPVYAYSLANDSKEIKLTKANATVAGGSGSFEKGKSTITISGQPTQYATNSTVFYYVGNDGTVNTYIGRNAAPSVSKSTSTAVYKNNAGTVVAVVFGGVVNKTSVGDHMFIYSVGAVSSNYTLANVILNGKDSTETIKIDANSADILSADTLYTYTVNSDGYYELSAVAKEAFYKTGVVSHAYSTSIVVDSGFEAILNSSTVVIDNHDASKTPTVAKNGNINKGDTVQILVSDTDKAVMVVITKLAGSTGDNNQGGSIVDGSGVVGISMSTNAAFSDVNKNLETDNVIIDGAYNAAGNIIKVPAGKTLVVKGNLNSTVAVDNAGTIIVEGTYTVPASTVTGTVQARGLAMSGATVIGGTVTVSGNVTGAQTLTIGKGRSLTVGGDLGVSGTAVTSIAGTGTLTVSGKTFVGTITAGDGTDAGTVTLKGDVASTGNVTVNKGSITTGKLTTTGNVVLTEGNVTVNGALSAAVVTLTKGDLTVSGAATATGIITVSGGCTLDVAGALTASTAATNVYGTANVGSLTATGQTVTVGRGNLVGNLTVNGAATGTIAVVNGTATIDGKTTGDVTLTKGTVEANEIDGDVVVDGAGTLNATAITNAGILTTSHKDAKAVVEGKVIGAVTVTLGTIEIGEAGAAATLTDGTLTVGNVTGALTLTKGTLNLNGTNTTALGTDNITPADVSIHLGNAAVLNLKTATGKALNISGIKGLTAASGATVVFDQDTTNFTVPADMFYSDADTAVTTISADGTYVYSNVTGGMGFLLQTP